MNATSVLYRTNEREIFKHFPEVGIIYPNSQYQKFFGISPEYAKPGDIDLNAPNVYSFLSEEVKVFISFMNGPYHFLHDTLGPVLSMIKRFPDAHFIFETSNMYFFDDSYLNHFYKTLHNKNIKFTTIKFDSGNVIVANNFYYEKFSMDCHDAGNSVYEFFSDDIKDKNIKPFRKIYLSRRRMLERNYSGELVSGPSFMHDHRILDEPLLEEFLSSIGFEVVVPEEFEDFGKQINHYHETKTVVSVTSSGLTPAAMFMQPRSNMVELTNTMVVRIGLKDDETGLDHAEESLHLLYLPIAFNKDHNYFSIPNKTRKAKDIIEKIEKSESLRSVFYE